VIVPQSACQSIFSAHGEIFFGVNDPGKLLKKIEIAGNLNPAGTP
jgi:hypothetical protein